MLALKADFLAMIIGTKVTMQNAKINWNDDDSPAQCAVCNDVRIFAFLSESMAVFCNVNTGLYFLDINVVLNLDNR